MHKPVIVFDVNETLLDMTPLCRQVNALLSNDQGFKIWFGLLLQYSLVENAIGTYHPFTQIAASALDMAAETFGVTITADQKEEALTLILQLPAYAEVHEGLGLLQKAGFRLIALTNSPNDTLHKQLEHAGIAPYFELQLSVHKVRKYKPAPETYAYAAKEAGVHLSDMLMVAAHGWDIAGALSAGMQAAFIARKGQALYGLSSKPGFVGTDIADVARQIIKWAEK